MDCAETKVYAKKCIEKCAKTVCWLQLIWVVMQHLSFSQASSEKDFNCKPMKSVISSQQA